MSFKDSSLQETFNKGILILKLPPFFNINQSPLMNIIFQLLLTVVLSQPYNELQTLQEPQGRIWSIDFSADSTLLVCSSYDFNVYVYTKNQSTFSLHQKLTEGTNLIQSVDITKDGQWLLAVQQDSIMRVYRSTNDTFQLFQTFEPPGGAILSLAGVITDDHEWIVFGTWASPFEVYVYRFNDSEYQVNQTITVTTYVRMLAITPDHTFLCVATSGEKVYIYKHNGILFNFLQLFTYTNKNAKFVAITDDHQYMTISDPSGKQVQIYQYSQEQEEYIPIQNNSTISYLDQSLYASISTNQEEYYVSTKYLTYIYTNFGGNLTEIQTLPMSDSHRSSNDGQYFVTSFSSSLTVYEYCNSSEGYYRVNWECQCDQIRDYFMQNGTCTPCQLEGCLDCQSLTSCLECNNKDNYFLQSGTCVACQLYQCQQCSSLTSCSQCKEIGNYVLYHGICIACPLKGCLNCKTLNICEECNEADDYYLVNGDCQKCQQEKDYFFQNGKCQKCILEDNGVCIQEESNIIQVVPYIVVIVVLVIVLVVFVIIIIKQKLHLFKRKQIEEEQNNYQLKNSDDLNNNFSAAAMKVQQTKA